ncbi:MAG: DNA polymerase III subunit gamma/tau [Planctomycetota bacterium]
MTTGAHYTVLARRFRPQAFDDVVGQEHVARALTNAIKAGRVAHAYMFTGARGVGKTSTARILAKALNCPNAKDGVPCNQCEICEGISAGNDVDVLEIDGASNRGIDDIRSLRANVGVRSMRTRFKVYIIDEVHMLTKEAFNALLKTLEEPPPNVKFVFCTTEPNKVPDTILSRCQRFDFSSIADQSIADRLRDIARIEGYEVSEDALELVSRRARGSMRDSQSLFDQLLAFSDGTVSAEDVHRMLGTAGDERLVELFHSIVEHRPGEVLSQLDAAFGLGVQPGELMDQCIGYVRDLIVTASGGSRVSLCSVASRHRDTLMAQTKRLGMHTILAAFQILSDAKNQMFRSTFARTVLEMAMVQLSLLENLSAISDLLSGRLPTLPDLPAPNAAGGEEKKNSDRLTPALSIAASTRLSPADSITYQQDPSESEPDHHEEDGHSSDLSSAHVATVAESFTSAAPEFSIQNQHPASISLPSTEIPANASQESPVEIELTEENCPRLLESLQKNLGLTIVSGLKKAAALFLAGPTRLEIVLENTADFARKVLDAPENRSRIETEVRRLTGKSVGIGLRLFAPEKAVEIAPVVTPATSQPSHPTPVAQHNESQRRNSPRVPEQTPAVNLLGKVDPGKDEFVRRIMDTFGATVVKVTVAPAVQTAATPEASGDE